MTVDDTSVPTRRVSLGVRIGIVAYFVGCGLLLGFPAGLAIDVIRSATGFGWPGSVEDGVPRLQVDEYLWEAQLILVLCAPALAVVPAAGVVLARRFRLAILPTTVGGVVVTAMIAGACGTWLLL